MSDECPGCAGTLQNHSDYCPASAKDAESSLAAPSGSDDCRRVPMEDPDMEWANELGSLSSETKTLVAQISCQARVIQQHRRACSEKDELRRSAEAQNQILRNALSRGSAATDSRIADELKVLIECDEKLEALQDYRRGDTNLKALRSTIREMIKDREAKPQNGGAKASGA